MIVGFVEHRLWLKRMALSSWYPQDSKQMETTAHGYRVCPQEPTGAAVLPAGRNISLLLVSPAGGRAGCMSTRSFPRNEPHLPLEGHLSLIELL